MPNSLEFTPTGNDISSLLWSMGAAFKDMTPVTQAMGKVFIERVDRRFATKKDPAGQTWKQWTPDTEDVRNAEGFYQPESVMQYHYELQQSLGFIADKKSVEVGFTVPYAKFHEQIDPAFPEATWLPHRRLLFANRAGDLSAGDVTAGIEAAMNALRIRLKL
jgi:hypothetical protein